MAIVTVLAGDDPELARPVLVELGVQFPTVEYESYSDPWNIEGLPLLFLVDQDGTVVHSELGYDSIGPNYQGLLRDLGW